MKKVQLFALATVATVTTLGFASSTLAGTPNPPKCHTKCGGGGISPQQPPAPTNTVTVTGGVSATSVNGKNGTASSGNMVVTTGANPSFTSTSVFNITGGNAAANTLGSGTAGSAAATLNLGATANTVAGTSGKKGCGPCSKAATPAKPSVAVGTATGAGVSIGSGTGFVQTFTNGITLPKAAVSNSGAVGSITVKK